MQTLLGALRAAAEPTRLRLLALASMGQFCVMELAEILGQSQPRLSRHLRLLGEAGLLERAREGANTWFTLPAAESEAGSLVRLLLERIAADDAMLAADRRHAARVLAERARSASEVFQRAGADWDEMRALNLPADAVERALLDIIPPAAIGRMLDIGTGTGALLERLAPRVSAALGVDASRTMLALARTRLAKPGLGHCSVRLADMYRLPLPDGAFELVVLQMVLHYAEDPPGVIAEAARVLRPGGRLVVVDLAPHGDRAAAARLAHRWPGFADASMLAMLAAAGLAIHVAHSVSGPLDVRVWSAGHAALPVPADLALEAVR
jgi:ubiquinone/menaquinone biosynthesis C-methylase UbiE